MEKSSVVFPESRVHVREEGEHHGEGGAGHAQREGDGQVGAVKEVDGVHERGPVEDGARPKMQFHFLLTKQNV